jgi:hypothetical protein
MDRQLGESRSGERSCSSWGWCRQEFESLCGAAGAAAEEQGRLAEEARALEEQAVDEGRAVTASVFMEVRTMGRYILKPTVSGPHHTIRDGVFGVRHRRLENRSS